MSEQNITSQIPLEKPRFWTRRNKLSTGFLGGMLALILLDGALNDGRPPKSKVEKVAATTEMHSLKTPLEVYQSYSDAIGNQPTTVRVEYTQGSAANCSSDNKASVDFWQPLGDYKPAIIGNGYSSEGYYFEEQGWVVQKTGLEEYDIYSFKASKRKDQDPNVQLFDPLDLDDKAIAYAVGKASVMLDDLRTGVSYINDASTLSIKFEANPDWDNTQYDLHMSVHCNS